ncbi:adenylate/guanylate cyclase domain-containing protein [Aquimarina rhabdastrellae]
MNSKIKINQYLKILKDAIIFWILMFVLFAIYRHYGTYETEYLNSIIPNLSIYNHIVVFVFYGFLIGFVHATTIYVFEKYTSKKLPIWVNLFVLTVLYLCIVICISTGIIESINTVYEINIDNEFGWWREDKTFLVILIYTVFSAILFSFLRFVEDKFGKGVLFKLLLGRYKIPKEEKRIFMFLDLKSSTAYAEKLGHLKYSQLLQECFYDINEVIKAYDAEIYQYVGDEAVLSWPYHKGIYNNNCIKVFFAFQDLLYKKKKAYLEKHGVFPQFKAGLHGGKVMAVEIGVIKKELAYHGDVINISSHIQKECNTYEVSLIISNELLENLENINTFKQNYIGNINLKGKKKKVKIHAIDS